VRLREEDEDDRSSELTVRTTRRQRFGDQRRRPVVGSGAGILLQQGEATREVRGLLNQSGRLRRRCGGVYVGVFT
jgi:hypothetical protein